MRRCTMNQKNRRDSKERIWLNWRFVIIAGLLLLLLVAMLPIFPALRDRWNQLTSSRSAPAVAHVTPTATPIGSPWWSGHNVSLTIVDGVAYVGAQDGIVSALRASDGSLLWHFMTKGSADGQTPVVNGVVYVVRLSTGASGRSMPCEPVMGSCCGVIPVVVILYSSKRAFVMVPMPVYRL